MLLGVCHVIFSNRWASLGSSLRFALRGGTGGWFECPPQLYRTKKKLAMYNMLASV
jgi:hypothetical protein